MKLKRKSKIISTLLACTLLFNFLLINTHVQAATITGQDVANFALQYKGYPYVYGAKGPNSFDCSGLVQYVYAHFGYTVSAPASSQAYQGVAVAKSDLVPGDLVFFENNSNQAGADHVGIYIGGGQFVHAANSNSGVIISSLSESYYTNCYSCARRIINNIPVVGGDAAPIKASYIVVTSSAVARSYPSDSSPVSLTLSYGKVLDIYAEYGDWYLVARGTTQHWVKKSCLLSKDFIRSVQHDLQRLNCLPLGTANVTGVLDQKTKDAIYQFRSIVALPSSYDVDSPLIDALNNITHKPVIGREWSPNPVATRYLQWWLGLPRTGVFDLQTEQKAKEWQKAAGVYSDPDGVIRPESWDKILKTL